MSGKVLLDTNIVIALFAKDQGVTEKLTEAEEVFIPSIVLGEIYYGAQNSSRVKSNVTRVDVVVQQSAILRCDSATAKCYGQIKSQLKIKGTSIPENNIWIAATALQFDLTLVTRDNHFSEVKNLSVERW